MASLHSPTWVYINELRPVPCLSVINGAESDVATPSHAEVWLWVLHFVGSAATTTMFPIELQLPLWCFTCLGVRIMDPGPEALRISSCLWTLIILLFYAGAAFYVIKMATCKNFADFVFISGRLLKFLVAFLAMITCRMNRGRLFHIFLSYQRAVQRSPVLKSSGRCTVLLFAMFGYLIGFCFALSVICGDWTLLRIFDIFEHLFATPTIVSISAYYMISCYNSHLQITSLISYCKTLLVRTSPKEAVCYRTIRNLHDMYERFYQGVMQADDIFSFSILVWYVHCYIAVVCSAFEIVRMFGDTASNLAADIYYSAEMCIMLALVIATAEFAASVQRQNSNAVLVLYEVSISGKVRPRDAAWITLLVQRASSRNDFGFTVFKGENITRGFLASTLIAFFTYMVLLLQMNTEYHRLMARDYNHTNLGHIRQ